MPYPKNRLVRMNNIELTMKITLKKAIRIQQARKWVKTYDGKNFVKGYSKKFAVDKLCAVRELRIIGVEISEEYEIQLRKNLESLRQQRLLSKQRREVELNASSGFESDFHFAMIMGYTSGGFAYGITHEEMEEIMRREDTVNQTDNQTGLNEDFDLF